MFIQAWSALKVCFGKLTDILRVRMELVTQSVAKITTRRLRQPSSIEIIDRWIFLRYNLLICLV